jgi:hypothetical protein
MATTIEIPKSEWLNFCDLFSRQHEGRLATMEIAGADLGDQLEAEQYSFNGISYDPKGTSRDSIDIELGADPDRHVNHAVSRPRRVMLLLTEEGAHEGLDIESEDGTKTIVRFQTAQKHEQITGRVNEEISRRMRELIGRLVQKKRRAGE